MNKTFFASAADLDAIIAAGPLGVSYDRDLAALLADSALNEYFFLKVADPSWLEPLLKAGKFSSIPSPKENASEGTVAFPFWPQGEYLKKIAARSPVAVTRVAQQLPLTKNPRVYDCIVEVALLVPVNEGIGLVPKVIEGIRAAYHLSLPLRVPVFISALAKAAKCSNALELAEAALELLDESESERGIDRSRGRTVREPRARLGVWNFEQALKSLPDLVDASPNETLSMVCRLLDRAIVLSDSQGEKRRPDDLSTIWRPAIEDDDQNFNLGLRDILVTAVRDTAEQIARKSPQLIARIVEHLEERGTQWNVFLRISLHLLRLFGQPESALVRDRLLNRGYFDSRDLRHEYVLLEKKFFGALSRSDQGVILLWIEKGPEISDQQIKRWQEFSQIPWTEEIRNAQVRQWKRDRLAPLEPSLSDDWKQTYTKLVAAEGEARHPEFMSYHSRVFRGPTSPQSRDDLGKLSIRELVEFLNSWKPRNDWVGQNEEGLGRELTSLVGGSPKEYAAHAREFENLSEPTYVRSVIQGFQNAIAQKLEFDWWPVLDLCIWAGVQRREMPDLRDQGFDKDPHWGWTIAAVCRLLTDGFSADKNPLPFGAREQVWRAIVPATSDPHPTREDERKYWDDLNGDRVTGSRAGKFDPYTNAINSVRGVAIETVIQYALWGIRQKGSQSRVGELAKMGFEVMPEVREVLASHLDIQRDPTLTIRSVYGKWAPWLQLLDDGWARRNTEKIFARENAELWHSAWDTFITYSQPFDVVFEWLRSEYRFAVEQIGAHDHGWSVSQGPDGSLSNHLMSFYWRGKLDLLDEIMLAFYQRADAKLLQHAFNFIGRSLRNTQGKISEGVANRLKKLCALRLVAATQDPQLGLEELREFGWWFSSAKFDDDWSLTTLLAILKITGQVEPDHLVIEQLVEFVKRDPVRSVEALKRMVEGDSKGWGILGWRENAKEILSTARKSGIAAAVMAAEETVNLLGRRGYFEFGEILKDPIP